MSDMESNNDELKKLLQEQRSASSPTRKGRHLTGFTDHNQAEAEGTKTDGERK